MTANSPVDTTSLTVAAGPVALPADLAVPTEPIGVVVFAHGSGSSRHSPRNRHVAEQLNARGLATLLLDLLTGEEDAQNQRTRELRFNIALLAERLEYAVQAAGDQPATHGLPIGLFGASTGAAAALIAAAHRPDEVRAVVSRGGRGDLAGDALADVRAPTLLIVGGRDEPVIGMNRQAMARMACETRLEIVAGASHLFEEPGALDEVARLAGDWFLEKLRA